MHCVFRLVSIKNCQIEYFLKSYDESDNCVCFKGQVTDTNQRLQDAGREVSLWITYR